MADANQRGTRRGRWSPGLALVAGLLVLAEPAVGLRRGDLPGQDPVHLLADGHLHAVALGQLMHGEGAADAPPSRPVPPQHLLPPPCRARAPLRSSVAITLAAAWPAMISWARLGPVRAAAGWPGSSSRTSCVIRSSEPRSKPFDRLTTGAHGRR